MTIREDILRAIELVQAAPSAGTWSGTAVSPRFAAGGKVEDQDQVRRCDDCGAECDHRVQVCECDPAVCVYPPVDPPNYRRPDSE